MTVTSVAVALTGLIDGQVSCTKGLTAVHFDVHERYIVNKGTWGQNWEQAVHISIAAVIH